MGFLRELLSQPYHFPYSCYHCVFVRCMMVSHSLDCLNVAIKCPIAGCGHNIRRDSKECHMFKHQGNHVKLLQSHMSKALWNANRVR